MHNFLFIRVNSQSHFNFKPAFRHRPVFRDNPSSDSLPCPSRYLAGSPHFFSNRHRVDPLVVFVSH